MALTNNEDPDPVLVKIYKKGADTPIKDIRGKTEVLDVIEIIEDEDIGTYIVEFTNTSEYAKDLNFIIKQISLKKEGEALKTSATLPSKLSNEEERMYAILESASQDIKHFEVEQ